MWIERRLIDSLNGSLEWFEYNWMLTVLYKAKRQFMAINTRLNAFRLM